MTARNNPPKSLYDAVEVGKPVIKVENLTKDYGGSGIFNIELDVLKGETIGYVGTNGSGKTTTIRHIMGFLKPQSGGVRVLGMDAWKNAYGIKKYVGYVPGEIAYPGVATGLEFLKIQAEFYNLKDLSFMNALIEKLQLDPTANLKRMSKGMKQKTALVSALMADLPILVLDEPSTGLDPLMREIFVQLILEEKLKGKTIFITSQLFDEVEAVCDRVALMRDGRIIDVNTMRQIRHNGIHEYKITFASSAAAEAACSMVTRENLAPADKKECGENTLVMSVSEGEPTAKLLKALENYQILDIKETKYNFEKYFKKTFRLNEGERNADK
jgi:ABC-2 type transport system ATP-binding protein